MNWSTKDKCDVFIASNIRPNFEGVLKSKARDAVLKLQQSMPRAKICASAHKITQQQYTDLMVGSKIVVCPWGMGERTACDEHALLAGALLMKPMSNYVLTYPDIYRDGESYVAVQADFSDLTSKLKHVLTHADSFKHVARRGIELLHRHGPRVQAQHWWHTVRALYTQRLNSASWRLQASVPDLELKGQSIRNYCSPTAMTKWASCQ